MQRAHQNTLESYSLVMLQMMFAGLKYPVTSAACGATYVVGRVIYGYGGRGTGGECVLARRVLASQNTRDVPRTPRLQAIARAGRMGAWLAPSLPTLATSPSCSFASRYARAACLCSVRAVANAQDGRAGGL